MKSLYNKEVFEEVNERIDQLRPDSRRLWGTMDVSQMLAHCTEHFRLGTGKIKPPRTLMGKWIGNWFRSAYFNDKPVSKGAPTMKEALIQDEKEFDTELQILRSEIRDFYEGGPENVTNHPHPFFGAFSKEEWGMGMYKHLDHHLRQFGV